MAGEQYFTAECNDGDGRGWYRFETWVYTYGDGHQERVHLKTYLRGKIN